MRWLASLQHTPGQRSQGGTHTPCRTKHEGQTASRLTPCREVDRYRRVRGANGEFAAFMNWQNPQHAQLLADHWNVEISDMPHATPPTHAMQIFRLAEMGSIRMLWIICTNPAVSMPELERIRNILKQQDLFVVVSDAFLTETGKLADLVLPAAMWGEKTVILRLRQPLAQLLSRPSCKAVYAACGEEILNEREVIDGGRVLCVACAYGAYFERVPVALTVPAAEARQMSGLPGSAR